MKAHHPLVYKIGNQRIRVLPGVGLNRVITDFSLAPYPPDEDVWLSPVVDFLSEYRCFVLEGQILDVRLYKGDWSKAPDRKTLEGAVAAWKTQPVAWTLDIGVTSKGDNLLVEVNDGYSFGNYGLLSTSYAQMLEARWGELVGTLKKSV